MKYESRNINKFMNLIDKIKYGWLLLFTVTVFIGLKDELTIFTKIKSRLSNILLTQFESENIKELRDLITDVSNFIRNYVPISIIWIMFFIIILIWVIKVYAFISTMRDKKYMKTIGHLSLNNFQFKFNKKLRRSNQIEVHTIDLIDDMNQIKKDYNQISFVVGRQDRIIDDFNKNINNPQRYGYMGIAHTPLILRAGYKIGDETRFHLFHKYRNKEYFDELNYSENYEKLKIEKVNINPDSRELVVAISTTFEIFGTQLEEFDILNKSVLKFKIDKIGVDVIRSYKQVEEYVNAILGEVIRITGTSNIKKIHMVISSSVAFTFALGQALSSHYHPEIIVYNYDINASQNRYYPWGISVFKENDDCLVVN